MKYLRTFSIMMAYFMVATCVQAMDSDAEEKESFGRPSNAFGSAQKFFQEDTNVVLAGKVVCRVLEKGEAKIPEKLRNVYEQLQNLSSEIGTLIKNYRSDPDFAEEHLPRLFQAQKGLWRELGYYCLQDSSLTAPLLPALESGLRYIDHEEGRDEGILYKHELSYSYSQLLLRGINLGRPYASAEESREEAQRIITNWIRQEEDPVHFAMLLVDNFPENSLVETVKNRLLERKVDAARVGRLLYPTEEILLKKVETAVHARKNAAGHGVSSSEPAGTK